MTNAACKERKSLTKKYVLRENAYLQIIVTFFEDKLTSDGDIIGTEVIHCAEVKIYVDGKCVAKGDGDKEFIYNTEMQGVEATRIGDKYVRGQHADQIKAIIDELTDELAPQFDEQTTTQK